MVLLFNIQLSLLDKKLHWLLGLYSKSILLTDLPYSYMQMKKTLAIVIAIEGVESSKGICNALNSLHM